MINQSENFIHLEIREGEVFFTNSNFARFQKINFISKRLGKVAYDGNGNEINNIAWHPVFLRKDEILASGKSLIELRKSFRDEI